VQLVHHGKKKNRWTMRLLYGITESAALNAFDIFNENVSNFGERKKESRKIFLKDMAFPLIIPHSRQRLEILQTPQDVKQVIRSCGNLPAPSPGPRTTQGHSAQRKKCCICPRTKNKKTKFICNECNNFVCEEHSKWLCNKCQE